MEPSTLKWVRRVHRQDFPMGRPRRVSPGAKSLFSDGLASARSCLSLSRAETPKLDVRLFLPLGVLLRAFGTSSLLGARGQQEASQRGGQPARLIHVYIKAISGDCLPPNPVMGTEIEISPWIKPVEIRVFVMEACVQCCGVVEAQRQERLGKEEPRGPAQGQECQNSQEIRSLSALQLQRCNPSKMPRKNLLLSQHRFLPLASQLSKGHGRRLIVARPSIGLCPHRDLPPFHRPVATGSAPSERAAVRLSHQGPCFMPWLAAARA